VIALSPDLIAAVKTGKETATIRKGHRDYFTGPAVFDAKRAKIPIEITAVEYKAFQDLTDEDGRVDGNVSKSELQASLKTYYPTIKNTDEVTIVHFRVLQRNRR
jgi:cytidine deaminase